MDFLVVNELEAQGLLHGGVPESIAGARLDAQRLAALGPAAVITLGAEGAVWASDGESGHVGARAVPVVDTTGAGGNAFVGVMAASLAGGVGLEEAVEDGVLPRPSRCSTPAPGWATRRSASARA